MVTCRTRCVSARITDRAFEGHAIDCAWSDYDHVRAIEFEVFDERTHAPCELAAGPIFLAV